MDVEQRRRPRILTPRAQLVDVLRQSRGGFLLILFLGFEWALLNEDFQCRQSGTVLKSAD
jgi:hypothetical protein